MATEKELKAAAKELNNVLGVDPPISVKGASIDDLKKDLKTAIELIEADDEFSEETQDVIDELIVEEKKPTKKGKKAPVIVEEEEEEEDIEEEIEEEEDDHLAELTALITNAKKLTELVKICDSNPEFKPLKKRVKNFTTSKELRIAMLTIIEPEEEEEEENPTPTKKGKDVKAAKEPTEKKKRFVKNGMNRIDCVCQILKTQKPKTIADWVAKADALFVAKGGTSNTMQALHLIKNYGTSLLYLGLEEMGITVPVK